MSAGPNAEYPAFASNTLILSPLFRSDGFFSFWTVLYLVAHNLPGLHKCTVIFSPF